MYLNLLENARTAVVSLWPSGVWNGEVRINMIAVQSGSPR